MIFTIQALRAGRSKFANHSFTRLSDYIFDPSVGKVDVDNDPDDGPPFTEYQLDGRDTWIYNYARSLSE